MGRCIPEALFKRNAAIDQGLEIKLIENTTCVCKDGRLVIPKPLQVHAVNSLTAKSILVGEKLVAMYSIST
jgi:hypothetical protein